MTFRQKDNAAIVDRSRWGWLVLFTSTSTIICCALPILLVTLGLGAVSASMFATFPILVTLAQHKVWLFLGSGLLLGLSAWAVYRPGRACPADKALAEQCETAHRWNTRILWVSGVIWLIGFCAAYFALPIFEWLEG
ncbi:MAG: hypothetical protein JKY60_02745 [Kordiimonadaceae bacterium]|nr:hypothetical protein [Kordiimonadaceae bacterium]